VERPVEIDAQQGCLAVSSRPYLFAFLGS
jgi:hypothetical protein